LGPTAVPSPVRRRYTYVGHACVEKSGYARVMPRGQAEQIFPYGIPAKVHGVGTPDEYFVKIRAPF